MGDSSTRQRNTKIAVERVPPPREEGWLRHQENFGEAHLSAADGVVAHKSCFGVSDHPVRFAYVRTLPPILPRPGNPRAAAHLFILKPVGRTIQLPNIHAARLR